MHALRIFLSSPGDVTPEREIARQVIDELGRSHLVRSKVMMQFLAWDDEAAKVPMDARVTPQESVNRVMGLPADCDLTVVLLWSRIGSPPAGLTRPNGSPYESGTVWEYENALGANKPVYVYRKSAEPMIGLKDRDFAAKRRQFEAVESFFSGFQNADGSLRAGFNQFVDADDFRRQFRQHLEAFLKPYLESSAPAAAPVVSGATFRWPSAWDFAAYMADKRGGFSGREWLFADVQKWLADPASRALLIRADFGVGKSAFLAELVSRNPGGTVVAWHFCQHDTRETLRAGAFVSSLAAHLRERLPGYREQVEARPDLQERLDRALEDPGSAFEAAVLNPLAALPAPPEPRLILIDALDEALEVDAEEVRRAGTLVSLLANKARRLPAWLQLVVTSRNNPEVIGRLEGAFTLTQIDAEGEHNRDDLHAFALHRAASGPITAQLAAAGRSAEWLADLLRDKAGGKFLYVTRALRDLEGGRLTLAQAGALPPGMDGFYRDAFERRFDRAGRDYEPYRALLGLLCALREPVSAEPLAELLGCEPAHVKQARALLPDFIVQRRGGYTFEHFSIAEWLSRENEEGFARAGPYAVRLAEAEAQIHDRALKRIAEGTTHQLDYLVRHLDQHLPDPAERQEAFTILMADYSWLRERLRLAGTDALIGDCQHLGEGEFRRLLAACLRNSAYVLRRNTDQLPGQLLGRLEGQADATGFPELCFSVRTEMARSVQAGERDAALLPYNASLRLDAALLDVREIGFFGCLAALPDGRLALTAGYGICLWDPSELGEPEVWLERAGGGTSALAVLSPDTLASGHYDGSIRLWDIASGKERIVLTGHGEVVEALMPLPDGRLASASRDSTIRLWDLEDSRESKVFEGHAGSVYALAVLPDGRIASGGNDGICLWDLYGENPPQVLKGHHSVVCSLAILVDGRLASGSWDGTIRLWDMDAPSHPEVLGGSGSFVMALTVLPDGRLVSSHSDECIRLWECARLRKETGPQAIGCWVSNLGVSPSGLIIAGLSDGSVFLCDFPRSSAYRLLTDGRDVKARALAALPDGGVAVGAEDCRIYVWDQQGAKRMVLEGHAGSVDVVMLLPDGRLASASGDGTVRFWDLATGEECKTLEGNNGYLRTLAVLPDGRIAAGGPDGICVWDTAGIVQRLVVEGNEIVDQLVALPDCRLVAAGTYSGISLWDLTSNRELEPLERGGGPLGPVRHYLTLFSDGRLLVAANRLIRLWHRGLNSICAEFEADALITCLIATPSGQIVAGDQSGNLHFLDLIERRW